MSTSAIHSTQPLQPAADHSESTESSAPTVEHPSSNIEGQRNTDSREFLAGYAEDFSAPSSQGDAAPVLGSISREGGADPHHINVMNASGAIRSETGDYQLEDGEAILHEPSPEKLSSRTEAMHNAVDPKQNDSNQKFGFPYSHFDHAFHSSDPAGPPPQTVTIKRGRELPLKDDGMRDTTSVGRLLNMMPGSMTADGHLERLSKEADPAHEGNSDPSAGADSDKVSATKFFESAAALKYARQQGYDPAMVHRHSATVDFRAADKDGNEVHFDPFMSPQPSQLSGQARQMRETLLKGSLTSNDAKVLQTKLDGQVKSLSDRNGNPTYKESPERWARGAYAKHTDNSKGTSNENVTGVWDQTSTPGAHLQKLHDAVKDNPGSVAHVDLKLDEEYAREDFLARQQVDHRNRNQGGPFTNLSEEE